MKLVELDSEIFRLTNQNYRKVLQDIVAGHSLSRDDLRRIGKSIGLLAANLDRVSTIEARSKLEAMGKPY
jgi:hypothetical protein